MKKSTVILLWGGATGVSTVIFSQILYATGQENSGLRWFNMLIIFLGLFIGTMKYRDNANGGYLSYGQGYKAGFFMSAIITVLITVATFIDLQLHPDFIDKILAQSRDNMINKGLPEDQIEMGMHYVKIFTTPFMMTLSSLFFGLLGGAILSLITAGLCSRKKPIFDDENTDTPQA